MNLNNAKEELGLFNKWKNMYHPKINSDTSKPTHLGLDCATKSIYVGLVMTKKEDLPILAIDGNLKNMADYIDKWYWFDGVALFSDFCNVLLLLLFNLSSLTK